MSGSYRFLQSVHGLLFALTISARFLSNCLLPLMASLTLHRVQAEPDLTLIPQYLHPPDAIQPAIRRNILSALSLAHSAQEALPALGGLVPQRVHRPIRRRYCVLVSITHGWTTGVRQET